jgi:hypothetical protein
VGRWWGWIGVELAQLMNMLVGRRDCPPITALSSVLVFSQANWWTSSLLSELTALPPL